MGPSEVATTFVYFFSFLLLTGALAFFIVWLASR